MVSVREIPAEDVDAAHRLHCRFTAQDVPVETVRDWYDDRPGLFVGAYTDSGTVEDFEAGDLVGVCVGIRRSDDHVELAGLGLPPALRGQGIGTRLVERFERNAADLGVERVSLGSAGGYVDHFYAGLGYAPDTILVRCPPGDPTARGDFEVVEERDANDVRKVYVAADEVDHDHLEGVREAFGDDDAIYIMEKALDG